MQHSNKYIITFAVIVTVILGSLLSVASILLKPAQDKATALDTKKEILKAVMDITGIHEDTIISIYDTRIESFVFDSLGNQISENEDGEPIIPEKIKIAREFKKITKKSKAAASSKSTEQIYYPLFIFKNKNGEVESYIVPVFGRGLWDFIWGYVALKTDLNTVKGVSFGHKAETPGLGARISDKEIQDRFKDKKLYNESQQFVSVSMLKGENNLASKIDDYHVDGMSGATVTGKGVTNMIESYILYYRKILEKNKSLQ